VFDQGIGSITFVISNYLILCKISFSPALVAYTGLMLSLHYKIHTFMLLSVSQGEMVLLDLSNLLPSSSFAPRLTASCVENNSKAFLFPENLLFSVRENIYRDYFLT